LFKNFVASTGCNTRTSEPRSPGNVARAPNQHLGCRPSDGTFVRCALLFDGSGLLPRRATPGGAGSMVRRAWCLHAARRSPSEWGTRSMRSRRGPPPYFLDGPVAPQTLCKHHLSGAWLSISVCFTSHHHVLHAAPASASPQTDQRVTPVVPVASSLSKGRRRFQSLL